MKILWITNTLLGPLGEKLNGQRPNGVWMTALLDDFKAHGQHRIVIASTAPVKQTLRIEEDGVTYYALPDNHPLLYDENKRKNIEAWSKLLQQVKPDIIQVWGTEFTHGLCALRLARGIPSVIYMQGVLDAIARYYTAGISNHDLRKSITLRDIIKRDSIRKQAREYAMNAAKEAEMLQLAGNYITENDWCETHIQAIAPKAQAHRCPLSINSVFSQHRWDSAKMERHAIMCTASGYPLKGLHIMLRALHLLKQKYPDVKLYVPGTKMVSDGSMQWLLRKRGYTLYIERLIKELNLSDNIVWLGSMSQAELAKRLSTVNAFVLCSALENHSSSLKEAMMVGVPSVASAVGGIPEYVQHGHNAMLYRFEEHELLARFIAKIFDDSDLAAKLSTNGRDTMSRLHSGSDIYSTVKAIYDKVRTNHV